ncbi:hypothetical protein K505DRAFT_154786 [Melanomma pulvis-pyrius CBS 109.77]|uniref:Uncharacterized protein n=1 Tax=Melanomma pulvis-pyrius CBS 109.77 TaxID=1314802 RepID=A0A6A6WPM9_9PLEO|nr:hypothetical protein K505DRAFT_154786 [Melanomma pulvis-pyrius CBS 109.77]
MAVGGCGVVVAGSLYGWDTSKTSPPEARAEGAAGRGVRGRRWGGRGAARCCDAGLSVRVRVFAREGSAVVGGGGCWNSVGRSWCLRVSLAAKSLAKMCGPIQKLGRTGMGNDLKGKRTTGRARARASGSDNLASSGEGTRAGAVTAL